MENPNKVDTSKLRREIRRALWACQYVWNKRGWEFILYHTYDGNHMEGSLHFKNRAFDGSLPVAGVSDAVEELRLFLGPEYDVVEEGGCLHVEWDPK